MNAAWDGARSRRPVRVTFALAGGGSLGTFVSAAVREVLLAIDAHNAALTEGAEDDPRLLHGSWGPILVDSVGGASAGALCGAQIVRALHDRRYLGAGLPLDALHTLTGDWVAGGDFSRYVAGEEPADGSAGVGSPSWTLLSGTRLFEAACRVVTGARTGAEPHSALEPDGVVGLAVTLTDMFGYHEPAEFAPERVLGHPSFGRGPRQAPRHVRGTFEEVRDLGVRSHAEERRVFVAPSEAAAREAAIRLAESGRADRARAMPWSPETARSLAAVCAASAALPFAFGPVSLHDRAAELEQACLRLYMDGGTLNNRPIGPALLMARWGDAMRLLRHRQPDGTFCRADIVRELVYERVCFFVDAFPDPEAEAWRAPEATDGDSSEAVLAMDAGAQAVRAARVRAVLAAPGAGADVFMQSLLSSLRAQDIREIARMNVRLRRRSRFIAARCRGGLSERPDFRIDTVGKAMAYAAVLELPCGEQLPEARALAIAERIWESDQLSGLSGRREVTMVPLFSPRNHEGALAGEALYTMGGLLSFDARMHDARVGRRVAGHVLAALRTPDAELASVDIPDARPEVVPEDAGPVVARLRMLVQGMLAQMVPERSMVRWLAGFPLVTEPLFRRLGARLDEIVRGQPVPVVDAHTEGEEAAPDTAGEEEAEDTMP